MPTYDYLCKACGARLELFQSMSEAPKRKCPQCGKQRLERQIGAGAGFLFKGNGFYQTDYRSESYKQAAKAEQNGSGAAQPGAADAKPADAKPAEAKPVKPADSKPAARGKDATPAKGEQG